MKILMTLMGLEIGGAETHVTELALALAARGHEIHVASNGGVFESELRRAGIPHYKLPLHTRSVKGMLQAYLGLRRIILAERFDVVHAHARIPAFLCGLLQKHLHFRFITSTHWVFKTGCLLNLMTNWGERSVAVSNDIKRYLMQQYNYPSDRIDVTMNGIDTEKFSPGTPYADVAAEFGLTAGKRRIVYVSRMDTDRSAVAFQLLDIFPQLLDRYLDLELVIVGGGNDYARLCTKVEAVNQLLGFRGVIATGARTDINQLVAAGDVFVGVSRAALEAMAAAKPVLIAGNEGYIGPFTPERWEISIQTNFCCRGCVQSDSSLLYEDLCELLNLTAEQLDAMGNANRRFIIEHYSVSRMADDYEAAYKKLLATNPFRPNDIVISGYYGFRNMGDDSLLEAILQNLRREKPDVSITVLSRRPKETRRLFNVRSINRYNMLRVRHLLKHSRLLLSGGGSLLQDVTSARSFRYYASVIQLAQRCGARVMVYANGIGPLRAPANRAICRKLLDGVDCITLRDSSSLEELEKIGVSRDKTEVTADPAFSLQYSEPPTKPIQQPYFIVSVREWKENCKDFEHIIEAFCHYIRQRYALVPVFVPMQRQFDDGLCKRLAQKTGGLLPAQPKNTAALLALMQGSRFVLGMRLHALIYALCVHVPLIGLSYDPKIDATVNHWRCCKAFPVSALDLKTLQAQADYVLAHRDTLSAEIATITGTMREKSRLDAKKAVELLF